MSFNKFGTEQSFKEKQMMAARLSDDDLQKELNFAKKEMIRMKALMKVNPEYAKHAFFCDKLMRNALSLESYKRNAAA